MIPSYLTPLANHLWQSTLFAAAIALMAVAFRNNRAAVRYALWMAASLKFLIPFSLLVSLGTQLGWRINPPAQNDILSVMASIALPFDNAPSTAVATATAGRSILPLLLAALWAVGCAAVVYGWGRESRRIRRTVSHGTRLDMHLSIPVVSCTTSSEPGIVGVFRPLLLLPEGIRDRLSAEQLQAVIAHEMCHARRRDNLTGSIHIVVESLFWFHPLVWWLERQLVAERESACDEEVLRHVAPETYAECILNVCRFYKEAPVLSMTGVTGSNLKKRIEAIMVQRSIRKLSVSQKTLLTVAAMAAFAAPVAVGLLSVPRAHAQAPAPDLKSAFEYLRDSEKPNDDPALARQAIGTLLGVLQRDPDNSRVIAALANGFLKMNVLGRSREFSLKYAALNPTQAHAFYAVGSVDWRIASDQKAPLPAQEAAEVINEGIRYLDTALTINPEYGDAISFKNLLFREKAKLESDPVEKQKLVDEADRLFQRSVELRKAQARQSNPSGSDSPVTPPTTPRP